MKVKKAIAVILLVFIAVSMTGCWNYRELENLAIVSGFAVDKGTNGAKYHLTIETIDTSGSGGGNSGGGGGGQSAISSEIIETDGDTIFDAVRNTLTVSDKKLYWGDCKVAIISSQLAAEGIAPLLDFINRDSEPRLTIDLFVSKENTAADVIVQKSPTNPITSYAIDKIAEDDSDYLSKVPYMQLYKVNDVLGSDGESLFLPALILDHENKNAPEADGTAVFKKDKLIGFLTGDESKYLLFVKGQVKGGLFLVAEGGTVPNITLEIKKCQTTTSADLTGKTPKIKINVQIEAALGEMETSADYDTESGIKKVEGDAEKTLDGNVKHLISEVQNKYDSDIFGFGDSIRQDDPYYWNGIKPEWNSLFKSLDVEVSADVMIKNTALTKSNVKVGD